MGLDISHDTWHGAYSEFMRWRQKIAEVAGLPPLALMQGFYKFPKGNELEMSQLNDIRKQLPIKWECLNPSPLHELLYHPDSDGYINYVACGKIADELEKLLPLLPNEDAGAHIGNWQDKTRQFIKGLRKANSKKEKLRFQ